MPELVVTGQLAATRKRSNTKLLPELGSIARKKSTQKDQGCQRNAFWTRNRPGVNDERVD